MADMTTTTLAFLGPIGWQEMIILAVLGVLIFGKRLPEVGKSIGKGIVEFKKGLSGIEDEVDPTPEARSQPRLEPHSSGAEINQESPQKTASPVPPAAGTEGSHNASA